MKISCGSRDLELEHNTVRCVTLEDRMEGPSWGHSKERDRLRISDLPSALLQADFCDIEGRAEDCGVPEKGPWMKGDSEP